MFIHKISSRLLRSVAMAFVVTALSVGTMWAQNISVTGTVKDSNGEPLPGVYVYVQGTTTGASTDVDGKYTLSAPANATLIFTSIGMKDAVLPVNNRTVINVVMEEDAVQLDDVVVVGYGTQRKANLTGSVATVDVSKTLESKSVTDLSKALQGAVPGLTIINSEGGINAEPSVTIRGIGTLSNGGASKPLYIVDGVPIDNLSYLNTNDIESISVLKDAASASIYGTRAAFGVVMITTKAANTTDRISISYSNNFGWSQATVLPNYPTVREQVDALVDVNQRMNLESELFGMYLDNPQFLQKVDEWQAKHKKKSGYREMVLGDDYYLNENGVGQFVADWDVVGIMFNRAAPSQSHNFAIQGSTGRSNYYMSFGYNQEQGLLNFNPDKIKRYTATVNVSTKATDWLEFGARVNFSDKTYDYPYQRRETYQYLWRWGSFFGPYGTIDGIDASNPIGYRKQAGDAYDRTANLRLGAFAKLYLVKGLTVNADYTFTQKTTRYKGVGLPVTLYNTWGGDLRNGPETSSTTTFVETSRSFYYNHVVNVYGNYELELKDHHFNLMAGFNADKDNYEYLYFEKHDIMDPSLPELSLSESYYNDTHNRTHNGSVGFFGRLNYDFKNKYLLEANIRYDGSSKFPEADRWAVFTSFSAGYRISEEEFFKPLKNVINNAKIRASYGEIGNQEVGSNMFLSTMDRGTVDWLGAGSIKYKNMGIPSLVSPTLSWESIATTNVGVDLGFLKGDLNVTFDWFQRDTRDMLAPGQTMPSILGASAPKINAGSLRSRGWEINIDYHHLFGQVNVYGILNVSDYKTKVTKWDNDTKLLNSTYTGKEYGVIWGFKTDRYFTSEEDVANSPSQKKLESGAFVYGPGDIKFVDVDHDGEINWGAGTEDDHGDLVKIGNTTPRYQYSLRLGAAYKGFDLDLYMQGVGKRDVWTQSAFVMPMTRGADALYANQTNYIKSEDALAGRVDQNADFPRLYGGGASKGKVSVLDNGNFNFYPQTKYLVNMAYLRMKNITLGYTIPQRITQKAHIERLRVYFAVNNAFDIINHSNNTGVDPEMNAGKGSLGNGVWGRIDPIYRTYSCGLQIQF